MRPSNEVFCAHMCLARLTWAPLRAFMLAQNCRKDSILCDDCARRRRFCSVFSLRAPIFWAPLSEIQHCEPPSDA